MAVHGLGGALAVGMIFWLFFIFSSALFSCGAIAAQMVGSWFTFKKMNLPAWKGLIPFYREYVLFDALWETKQFWQIIIFYGIYFVCFIIGYVLFFIGLLFSRTAAMMVFILLLLALLMFCAALVMAILACVKFFQLYKRLAFAFGKSSGWAWGLLFVPFVMLPIIGFSRNIVYYGPVEPR